jgi:hypothetical protein
MRYLRHVLAVIAFSQIAYKVIPAATPRDGRRLGVISGPGSVMVDGVPAPPGTSLCGGDVISTVQQSAALVSFLSGTSTAALPARIAVNGAALLIGPDGVLRTTCRIAAVKRTAAVYVDRSGVEIHCARDPFVLSAGDSTNLEAGISAAPPRQTAGQLAGKVSGEIPIGVVQRQGQPPEIPLNLSDNVNWQDMVRTLKNGRVRIALLDGSFLNIGARSMMRIVKHDPQTQQTQIELTLGRIRGEVIKLTKPGASFQVQTPTAVIGVVGTTFVVIASPKLTLACSIVGSLSVRHVSPAIPGEVILHDGQCVKVALGQSPGSQCSGTASILMNQTDLPSQVAPGARSRWIRAIIWLIRN